MGVIPRLIDLGIKPYLIPPSFSVAIAQRLIRSLCPDCKKKIKPKKEIRDLILAEVENMPQAVRKGVDLSKPFFVFEAAGCKKCNNTGYAGRTGVFEVLEMTPTLAEITVKEPSEIKIEEEAKRQGMVTMKQDGILKVLQGVSSVEEVLRMAEEK
jgi:type IV pilus assembly protein PilB